MKSECEMKHGTRERERNAILALHLFHVGLVYILWQHGMYALSKFSQPRCFMSMKF